MGQITVISIMHTTNNGSNVCGRDFVWMDFCKVDLWLEIEKFENVL